MKARQKDKKKVIVNEHGSIKSKVQFSYKFALTLAEFEVVRLVCQSLTICVGQVKFDLIVKLLLVVDKSKHLIDQPRNANKVEIC